VALMSADDGLHRKAAEWLAQCNAQLHTVEAVLTETAFFLPPLQRAALADIAAGGTIRVHRPDDKAYSRIAAVIRKYADLNPDWADASLVWLAEESGIHAIATLDIRDFSTLRIHGRSKFHIEPIR
jgi:predicted nucleic acid-binding protein